MAIRAALTTGVVYLRNLLAGGGSASYTPSGPISKSVTQVGTDADTNEKDLFSFSLPANSLDQNGRGLRIIAFGTYAANGNTKTVKIYFGSTVVSTHSGTTNNATWTHYTTILRRSATTQVATHDVRVGASNATHVKTTPTETLSGAVTIRVTGQNGSANANDIVLEGVVVEILP